MMAPRASSVRARERLMNMTAIGMKMQKIDLSACMKEIREVRGFNMIDIAEVLNMRDTAYSQLERGATQMKVWQLVRLCQFYGMTPVEFLGWRE